MTFDFQTLFLSSCISLLLFSCSNHVCGKQDESPPPLTLSAHIALLYMWRKLKRDNVCVCVSEIDQRTDQNSTMKLDGLVWGVTGFMQTHYFTFVPQKGDKERGGRHSMDCDSFLPPSRSLSPGIMARLYKKRAGESLSVRRVRLTSRDTRQSCDLWKPDSSHPITPSPLGTPWLTSEFTQALGAAGFSSLVNIWSEPCREESCLPKGRQQSHCVWCC